MARNYVAIYDSVHNLLREVTRHTPLGPSFTPAGEPVIEYSFRPNDLPEAYYTLAVAHSLQGVPLAESKNLRLRLHPAAKAALPELVGYFDAVRLDLRCCRDLRLKTHSDGPVMLSAELLSFGTGILRAANDDPSEQVHRHLWSRYGRFGSPGEAVFARIRALHQNSMPVPDQVGKETFESTNVIYGDALGELEQLWERRADTVFLKQVADSLQIMRRRPVVAAFCHPPRALGAVIKLHLKAQAYWKAPPTTARSLLKRIEFILERTTVDNCPKIVYRWRETQNSPRARYGKGPIQWREDPSGYDGWLDSRRRRGDPGFGLT